MSFFNPNRIIINIHTYIPIAYIYLGDDEKLSIVGALTGKEAFQAHILSLQSLSIIISEYPRYGSIFKQLQ
jgi:hypothetical protein